jgi:2-oxoisovalerate dehydrogenase E1 component
MLNPEDMRKPSFIEFKRIPVNQYDKTLKDELERYKPEDLVRIQRDMMIIRAFETMLNDIKLWGSYQGIEYSHKGPAHLSIGQEAAAVGQAFGLGIDDHIYGSHRSHGEILAKGLSAIEKLDDETLMHIMENYFGGDCLGVVEKDADGAVKPLAIDYLLYGTLAEIFGRRVWAARCTHSSRLSESIPTMRSWAAQAISRLARRCTKRSITSRASL